MLWLIAAISPGCILLAAVPQPKELVVVVAAAAAMVATVISSLASSPMSNTWYMLWAGAVYCKLEDVLCNSIKLR